MKKIEFHSLEEPYEMRNLAWFSKEDRTRFDLLHGFMVIRSWQTLFTQLA